MPENVEKKIPVVAEDDDFDVLDLDMGSDEEDLESLETTDDTVGEVEDTQADENDADESDDDADVPEVVKPEVAAVSKEDRKIHALKKEIIKLQAQNKELEVARERKQEAIQAEDLKAKYVKDGYSEEEANVKAQGDLKQAKLEAKVDLFEFQMNNASTLAKYSKAKEEASRIMSIAKSSKMSAEQVCRGLYGVEIPEREKRAKDAVLGKTSNYASDTSVANASRTAVKPTESSLTESERRFKTKIERMFLDGEKMSDADYIKKYRK